MFSVSVQVGTVVPTRVIVAVLTEKKNRRAPERLAMVFATVEDRLWQELGTEPVQQLPHASLSVFD